MSSDDRLGKRFARKGHELELVVVSETLDGQRKEARVQLQKPQGTAFTIQCDEGAYLNGQDTAPPPLAYLSSSIAF
jgi:hypothetical protein